MRLIAGARDPRSGAGILSVGSPEFVDGFGLCSPGRWRPLQTGRLCSEVELEHARALQGLLRDFVVAELPDPRKAAFMLASGHLTSQISSRTWPITPRLKSSSEKAGLMLPSTEAAVEAEFGPGKLLVAAMGTVAKRGSKTPCTMVPTALA